MSGISDLDRLVRSMQPEQVPGEFVFVTVDEPATAAAALAMVREDEGVSLVLPRAEAEQLGYEYDFIGAWITLRVRSALAAVGLTAAVSTALAAEGISCNMIAGRFHDHLLVPHDRADDAMVTLRRMASA